MTESVHPGNDLNTDVPAFGRVALRNLVNLAAGLSGLLLRPASLLYLGARFARPQFSKPMANPYAVIRRRFDYDVQRLPNAYLSTLEAKAPDVESAYADTGLTIGYPSWPLLYYALLSSLPTTDREAVVVETGTNFGASTIVLAQALKDANVAGHVHTVDISEEAVEVARRNVENAGLTDRVKFHVEGSVGMLKNFVTQFPYIDFAFLDGDHHFRHVLKEFTIIYPRILACKGKVYFDNTLSGVRGVAPALRFIRGAYGGNLIEFENCSGRPPGNAIWQPK